MYNICAFATVRSFISLVKNHSRIISQNYRKSFSSTHFPIDNINNLKKDVILYSHENKLFKFLPAFGLIQSGVWVYFGATMYETLTKAAESSVNAKEFETKSPILKRLNINGKRFRLVSACLCAGLGILAAFVSVVLPSRMVRQVKLFKGGNTASFLTYNVFGRPLQHKTSIRNINCINSRRDTKAFVTLKIKSKWFYYLLDRKGNFYEPKLFDYTVGTKPIKAY